MSDIGTVEMFLLTNSKRGAQFIDFAEDVVEHIDNYTVPQYGDAPNDQAEQWTAWTCIEQAKKYLNRFGRNARPGQDRLDMLKCAHYIQLAYSKLAQNPGVVDPDSSTKTD